MATIITGFNSFTDSQSQLLQSHWTRNVAYRWDIYYLVEGKWGRVLDRYGSDQQEVADNCEHGDKVYISTKFGIILD
jgi:hypothetical protein